MKKKNLLILAQVCIVIVIVSLLIHFSLQKQPSDFHEESSSSQVEITQKPTMTPKPTVTPADVEEEILEPEFVSPIDFESWQSESSDIFAWIEIPNTEISYPILNRADDNEYYLRRDIYGDYDSDGVIFTENYNNTEFTDPVTVIYGHNLRSLEMFGSLDKIYSNPEKFKENNLINIYLPNETNVYKVFAAVPYSKKHILYYNNFSDEQVFDNFINEIKSTRSLDAVIDKTVTVNSTDNIIILSTCNADGSARFLVLAVKETT